MDYDALRQRLKDTLLQQKDSQMNPYTDADKAAFQENMMPQSEADQRKQIIGNELFNGSNFFPEDQKQRYINLEQGPKSAQQFYNYSNDGYENLADQDYKNNRDRDLLQKQVYNRQLNNGWQEMLDRLSKAGIKTTPVDE